VVRVDDRHPFRVGLDVHNHRPPSVGAEEVVLRLTDLNLTGRSDVLQVSYGIARSDTDGFELSGLDNVAGAYAVPINVVDTTLAIFGSRSDSSVVEEPFDTLNIDSELTRYGVTLRQPLWQRVRGEFALAVTLERGESRTFLLGEPFDLAPGSVNGRTHVTVLRFAQEWFLRDLQQAFAIRSTVSFGIDAFDTTDNGTDRDATFVSWLGQAQYVRRLFDTASLLVLRVDGQVTDDPLLSIEQFSVGGWRTVRGYRENQLVRDQGVAASVEVRLPVLFDKKKNPVVQLAPFVDVGGGWNNEDPAVGPATIASVGVGLLLTPNRHVNAELYWGYAFQDFDTSEDDPQDAGFHFRVSAEAW